MGACLSCLGLRSSPSSSSDRTRLLDPSNSSDPSYAYNYGSWGAVPAPAPSQNLLSPEEARREQEALDKITRWASDQIVEIFPHHGGMAQNLNQSATVREGEEGSDGEESQHHGESEREGGKVGAEEQEHQDILLSMIPGDKSKRSIRIYPASRPGSRDARPEAREELSLRSQRSIARLDGSGEKGKGKSVGVFVKMDVDLP